MEGEHIVKDWSNTSWEGKRKKEAGRLDNENCWQALKQPSPKEQNGSEGLESSNLGKGIKNGEEPNGEEQQMTNKREESPKDLASRQP